MTAREQTAFRPGAIVRLRSGGPEMTVTRIGAHDGMPSAWCVWAGNRKASPEPFPAHVLEPATPEAAADAPDYGEAPCGTAYCRRLPKAVIERRETYEVKDMG